MTLPSLEMHWRHRRHWPPLLREMSEQLESHFYKAQSDKKRSEALALKATSLIAHELGGLVVYFPLSKKAVNGSIVREEQEVDGVERTDRGRSRFTIIFHPLVALFGDEGYSPCEAREMARSVVIEVARLRMGSTEYVPSGKEMNQQLIQEDIARRAGTVPMHRLAKEHGMSVISVYRMLDKARKEERRKRSIIDGRRSI